MLKRSASIVLIFLILQACNSKQVLPTASPITTSKPPIVLPSPIPPSATTTDKPTKIPTQVTPTQTPVSKASLNPCTLVSQRSVETILGEMAQTSRELNMCIYLANSGSRSISVGLFPGDKIKISIMDTIAQLHSDCSLSFQYSSSGPTSTPFPREIQELENLPLKELMILQDKAFHDCGWAQDDESYRTIEGLGDFANFRVLDLDFLEIGAVSVAWDEMYLVTQINTNQGLDRDLALEACTGLAQEALEKLQEIK